MATWLVVGVTNTTYGTVDAVGSLITSHESQGTFMKRNGNLNLSTTTHRGIYEFKVKGKRSC